VAAITAPHPEEQRHDPRAWAEGADAAERLDPHHIQEVITAQKAEAEQATIDLRRRWDGYWDLYDSQVDLSDKEDWQAQLWINKPFTTVEQATGLIQRAVVDAPEFWGIEAAGGDRRDQALATQVWEPVLKHLLGECHFPWKYLDAVKCGFVTGTAGYLKFRWPTTAVPMLVGAERDPKTGQAKPVYRQRLRSTLAVDWVDPRRIYRDPDSTPRENYSGTFLYHSEWKERPALRAMQQAGWDTEAIERVLTSGSGRTGVAASPTSTSSDQRAAPAERSGHWARSKFRHSYLVDEGWVDLVNEHGDVVFPDALVVHCNGEILYGPTENPLWAVDLQTGRRKWPFLAGAPLCHPKHFDGRGLIEQIQDLAWVYSNLFMLFMDGMNWVVNPPTEVQQDALVDWDDLDHYPGKLWLRKGAAAALTPAAMGKLNVGEVLGALQYIEQIMQNSSFVTDFAIGLPGTRSNITLGEVQVKTAQSLSIFEAIGRNLELLGREAVELGYNMASQFLGNWTDPSLERILGDANAAWLAQAPLAERMEALQGNFDFSFTGVTQALQKSDQLERLNAFGRLAATPPYFQLLAQQGPAVFMEVLQSHLDVLGLRDKIHIQTPQAALPAAPGMDPTGLGLPPEVLAMLGAGAAPGAGAPAPPAGRAQLAVANGVGPA
jgi:hypothetical protein